MNVFVIGASGFIGRQVMSFFTSKHYNVTGVDIIGYAQEKIIIEKDFEKSTELITKYKFDIIINCAGSSNVSHSFIDPKKDFELNTSFVQSILMGLKKFSPQTKFINLSSAAVYGSPNTLPINENFPTQPISPYGLHKLLSEQLVTNYCLFYGIRALNVRIFSAYGPGLKRQFFYDLYSKFKANKKQINLIGSGNESRDFIFISDIINGLDVLIHNAAFNGEIYNLASAQESFINTTSQLFANICGYKGDLIFNQQALEGYPINWKADVSKLSALGFSPKVDLIEGLTLYHQWLKNNYSK